MWLNYYECSVTAWKNHATRRDQLNPRRVDLFKQKAKEWKKGGAPVRGCSSHRGPGAVGPCSARGGCAVTHCSLEQNWEKRLVFCFMERCLPVFGAHAAYLAAGWLIAAVTDQPVMSVCRCSVYGSRAMLMRLRDARHSFLILFNFYIHLILF